MTTTNNSPARTFQPCTRHNVDDLSAALGGLQSLFEGLVAGAIPAPAYTLDDLEAFARSAVEGQRDGANFAKRRSWGLSPDAEGMPKDARHEFIMLPTWIVVSILAWLIRHQPERAGRIAGLDAALRAGLEYSIQNRLHGPGMGGYHDTLEALRLFAGGGVTALTMEDAKFCPELRAGLRALKTEFTDRRDKAGNDPAWGALTRADHDEALRFLAEVVDG